MTSTHGQCSAGEGSDGGSISVSYGIRYAPSASSNVPNGLVRRASTASSPLAVDAAAGAIGASSTRWTFIRSSSGAFE